MSPAEMRLFQLQQDRKEIEQHKDKFLEEIKSAASSGKGSTTWYRISSEAKRKARDELIAEGYQFTKIFSGWGPFKDYRWKISWGPNTLGHAKRYSYYELPD